MKEIVRSEFDGRKYEYGFLNSKDILYAGRKNIK
jgi:hypothetical protein